MNLVSIDKKKCNNCGICALRCPLCFVKQNGEIAARVDENLCNLCGHCVALCPADAIVHHTMDMDNFIKIEDGAPFGTDEFIQFLRERRSHRHFKDKQIPREHLNKLVDVCRYAPTGGNVQSVEIIVVQDQEKRQRLSDLTVDFFLDIGAYAETTLKESEAEGKEPEDIGNLEILAHYKNRLGQARAAGYDPIFHKAPAILIFHSHSQTRTPKDNCVIASTLVGLTARTMGLETTYIGLFEVASRMYQAINEELGLPPGHEIYSVLIMGYPKLKFHKTVDRRPIKTRWE